MDKVKKADQATVLEKTAAGLKKHAAAHPEVAFTSAEDGTGVAELRASLATLTES